MDTARRIALVVSTLLGACTTGRFRDELDVGNHQRIRQGMSADELKTVMGEPDVVSSGERRRFLYQFGRAGEEIAATWTEWAWVRRSEDTYVAYVSGDVVQRVGVIVQSPMPSD